MATRADGQAQGSTVDWNAMDGMLHRTNHSGNSECDSEQESGQLQICLPVKEPPPSPSFKFTPATVRILLRMVAEMTANGHRPGRQAYAKRMRQLLGSGPYPTAEKIRLKIKSEKERFERQVKLNSIPDRPKVEIDPLLMKAFAQNGMPDASTLRERKGVEQNTDHVGENEPKRKYNRTAIKRWKKPVTEATQHVNDVKHENVLQTMSDYLKTLTNSKQDEDDLWLLSLGPALRRLEPLQKGLVKIKIQQFLLEAEFGVEVIPSVSHTIPTQHVQQTTHQQMETAQHLQPHDHNTHI